MRNTNKILVVIPTYNEIANIQQITRKILLLDTRIDILFVDDNSPDGTGEEAERLANLYKNVYVIHRPAKMGMGRAYVDGFNWGLKNGYEYICEMDADFSHNPDDLPRLLAHMQDCDICIGSRYVKDAGVINWPIWREILSRGANIYIRYVTGMLMHDATAGFKCFRRKVLEFINPQSINSEGYSFQIEMHYKAWKAGFKIKEIPIIFIDRSAGHSKMSKKIIVEAFFIVWKLIMKKDGR